MQKMNKKLNENIVGAGPVSTHEKGITLIALIITIIVMLILVGVTINVALNGGLFTKAEQAKTGTQLAIDREKLQIAVVSALNDDREISNAAAIKNNLQEGWTVTPGTDGTSYICTSPNENVFTVDNKGNIKPGSTGNTNPPQQDLAEIGQVNNQNGEPLQLGDYITYNNETWVVMYNDDTNGLQIISQNPKSGIELKGKEGFNNAISLLNKECEKYIKTGAEYARGVGTSPTFYKDEVETVIDEYGMDTTNVLENQSDLIDYQPFITLFSTGKISATEDFLVAVRERYSSYDYVIPYYSLSEGDFDSICLCELDESTDEIVDCSETTKELEIFPVMIMNKNIEITGGDGATTPYTYTFNEE